MSSRRGAQSRPKRNGSSGQIIVMAALTMVVMVGIAAITVDGARARAAVVNVQVASDIAALYASDAWSQFGGGPDGQPAVGGSYPESDDAEAQRALIDVPWLASINGVHTDPGNYCVVRAGAQVDVIFYDVPEPHSGCSSNAGWTNSVEVTAPVDCQGESVPSGDCIEVHIRQVENNFLGGIFRAPTTTIDVKSIARGGDRYLEPSS